MIRTKWFYYVLMNKKKMVSFFFFCIQFKTLRVKYCKLTFYLCEILKWIWHCSLERIADWKICHFLRFLLCVCVFVCVLIFQFQMNMSVVSQIFSQIKSWNNYIKNVKLCFTGFYFMSWFTYIPTYFKKSYGEYTSYVMARISVFTAM